jgi:starvation-inducible DNA-binding protein
MFVPQQVFVGLTKQLQTAAVTAPFPAGRASFRTKPLLLPADRLCVHFARNTIPMMRNGFAMGSAETHSTSTKEPFMAFETSPNGSNGGAAPSAPAHSSGTPQRAPAPSIDHLADVRIALARKARAESVDVLNQILADTMTLRDLYKKHHWQTSGATFYELHLLFDKHHEEQEALIDTIAERIQTLGGTSLAMAADVAETTLLARPPRNREEPSQQLARLADAHERVLYGVRAAARRSSELGDDGTSDLLVSEVIRTNEKQAWFIQEHLQRRLSPK